MSRFTILPLFLAPTQRIFRKSNAGSTGFPCRKTPSISTNSILMARNLLRLPNKRKLTGVCYNKRSIYLNQTHRRGFGSNRYGSLWMESSPATATKALRRYPYLAKSVFSTFPTFASKFQRKPKRTCNALAASRKCIMSAKLFSKTINHH